MATKSTQEVVDRSNAMLAQTKAEGSKPFAGSSYATPIVATDLNPQSSPNLPPEPVPENTNAVEQTNLAIAPGLSAEGMTYTDGKWSFTPTDTAQTEENPQGNYTSIFDSYLNSLTAPPDTIDIYSSERDRLGVDEKQATYNKYAGRLNAINAKRDAAILQLEGDAASKDLTKGYFNAAASRISREAAIEALPVQAQLAAAQGDLKMAQETLNTMFQIKSQDALAQYQFKQNVANSLFDFMNESEKRRMDQVMKQEDRKYTEQQDFLKTQQSLMQNAVAQGAPQDVVSGIGNAENFLDMMSAAGVYAGDVLDRQIKLEQLKALRTPPSTGSDGIAAPTVKTINGRDMQWNSQTGQWEEIPGGTGGGESDQVFQTKENIKSLDNILNHSGLNSAVGPGALRRIGILDKATGQKASFIGDVENVLSILTLNSFAEAKARGMTFGALSEGEWNILRASASKIGQWRVTDPDTNKVIGYEVSEKAFKAEIEKLKQYQNRNLTKELGYDPTYLPGQESMIIDAYIPSGSTPAFNPSSFY